MPTLLLLFLCSVLLGAITGYLFHFRRFGHISHPLRLPVIGVVAGITAFIIFQLLTHTTGAPLWLLPLLVIFQVWLWLGPLGPKRRAD